MGVPSFYASGKYHSKRKKIIKSMVPPPGPDRIAYSLKILDACDIRPVVLVCDPVSAIGLLERRQVQKRVGDLLIFDEPMAGVDPSTTRAHARIMRNIPAMTILMSATLPDFDSTPGLVARARSTFGPELETLSILSNRIASPCTVVDANASVFGPHRLFRGTAGDLATLLRKHLHLLRLFSPRAVLQLMEDTPASAPRVLLRRSAEDACDFEAIRQIGLDLLDACGRSILPLGCDAPYQIPRMDLIVTLDAHLLTGTSIVLSENEDSAWQHSLPLLLEGGDRLNKRLAAREAAVCKASNVRLHTCSNRRAERDQERESQMHRQRREADLRADLDIPPLWPAVCCVNSAEHHEQYAPRSQVRDPTKTRLVPCVPEDILQGSCEALVEGLLCGFCTLNSKFADRAFSLAALELAEARAFTFLSGGRSAIYGVNLPCDRVILALNAASTSTPMLVQSLGRCGRTGKYSRSEVVFATLELLDKMFDEKELAGKCAEMDAVFG